MSEANVETTTYEAKVGDRVRFLGLDTNNPKRTADGGGAWDMLPAGTLGTVEYVIENDTRMFVVFDHVEMPFANIAKQIGMPSGWPILTSEVEKV